jgi:hypothetical protein
VHGFGTGDMVKAIVPRGIKAGIHFGRVAIRATGFFNVQTSHGLVQGISYKHCLRIQRNDGYGYFFAKSKSLLPSSTQVNHGRENLAHFDE